MTLLEGALGVGRADNSHRFTSGQTLGLGEFCFVGLPVSVVTIRYAWLDLLPPIVGAAATVIALVGVLGTIAVVGGTALDWLLGRGTDKKALMGSILAVAGIALTVAGLLWIVGPVDDM